MFSFAQEQQELNPCLPLTPQQPSEPHHTALHPHARPREPIATTDGTRPFTPDAFAGVGRCQAQRPPSFSLWLQGAGEWFKGPLEVSWDLRTSGFLGRIF